MRSITERTMAFTQTDLDNINAAIATGALTVERNGRRVTYRSIADLKAAKEVIESELQRQRVSRPQSSYRFTFTTGRGY